MDTHSSGKPDWINQEKGSLRQQILMFAMSMISICTLIFGLSFFWISRSIVQKNRIDSALDQIDHAAYRIEQELNGIAELMDYIFVDKQIQDALDQETNSDYARTLQWNKIYSALGSYERLDCFHYINCILIYNKDGNAHSFRYMALDTSPYIQRNEELGWHQAAIENEGRLIWGTTVSNDPQDYEAYSGEIGTDISLMRALRVRSYKQIQGAVYLSIQPSCLSIMQPSNGLDTMTVYLIDDAGRILNPDDEVSLQTYLDQLAETPWTARDYRYCENNGNMVYERLIPTYGYRLIVIQPDINTFIMDSNILFLAVTFFCVLILIALSLWLFLTRKVIRPMQVLASTMQQVHTEGLSVRATHESNNEFDYLASNFNYMLDQIQQLMQTNLEKERATQEAEYKATLAQINPHFLYNALFAIRMMAVFQKAENIQNMVDALWRMLKNSTTRGKNDFTLRDEIQNVEDYVHIIKASNVQKFHVTYDIAPELYDTPCPKFLIQPVVENAIIHGVFPKHGFSTIEIQARTEADKMIITVSNDGLPIPAERLAEVTSTLNHHATAHKGLGLSSIHHRLQLLYGAEAGLTITSDTQNEKTVVTIHYGKEMRNSHV